MPATFPGGIKNFGVDRANLDYIPASDTNDLRAEVVALETVALAGWVQQTEAWYYGTPSAFIVVGDRTAFYTKGRRIRWMHVSTYRYGVIVSAVYQAPNTLVTILVNNDYVFSNLAFLNTAVSDLDDPPGWPGWFAWLPAYSASGSMTFTAVTTQLAKYRVAGRACQFMFRASGTLGGVAGTGVYITCPVAPVVVTGTFLPFTAGNSETAAGAGVLDTVTPRLMVQRYDAGNYGLAAGKVVYGEGFYEW